MHIPDLFNGFSIGLVFGIIVGTTWEYAFEMIREAVREMRNRRERTAMENKEDRESDADRRRVRRLGWLLAFTSVVMMVTGGATVYLSTRLSNFVQCQARYNQQASEARQPRVKAANRENDALYAWLATLPPLLSPRSPGTPPDPRQVKAFRLELTNAIKTHVANVEAQKVHPFPPDPKDTCGEY